MEAVKKKVISCGESVKGMFGNIATDEKSFR
jgi:hypothetical protein